jgi:hypothetical protein
MITLQSCDIHGLIIPATIKNTPNEIAAWKTGNRQIIIVLQKCNIFLSIPCPASCRPAECANFSIWLERLERFFRGNPLNVKEN